nr:unnamed protein product [Spirometra erinaceieuropaei]
MELFDIAFDNFGLAINTEKTEVMHQPPPDAAYIAPSINVNGDKCKTWTTSPTPVPSARHRLESPRPQPQHQSEDVQGSHSADAAVWSGYLDGVQEAGVETQSLPAQPSSVDTEAEMADRVLDTDVLERMGVLRIYVILRQLQLRWSGHLVRIDDEQLPK